MNMKEEYPVSITMDVDWALILHLFMHAICLKKWYSCNYIATHSSPALEEIKDRNFEMVFTQIFLQTHLMEILLSEIMDYMMNVVPDAECMRTHICFKVKNVF